MAGGKLEVQIGADKTDFDKKIKEVEFDIKELSKVKLDRLKIGLDTSEINSQIKDAKASLNSLKTTVKDTGQTFASGLTPKVANAGNTLTQFSRIAQDAPYGIIGIGNNITATAESFSYLKQQTGSTGGALKALASSLMGTGGILLGVSVLTTGFTLLAQSGLSFSDVLNKLTGNTDAYKEALKEVNKEAYGSKAVQEAVTNVNSLTNEIRLAKEGFLDKDQVVQHYNETIGKTTGLVTSIEEVEKSLIQNGDAYIKMTLYKAAATLALEAAAKSQLEAEKVRIKKLEEFTNAFLDADLTQTRSKEQYDQKQKDLAQKQKNRQLAEIKENENAAKINLSIAKKFQEDAAKIAKDFKFNFFGDNKEGKKTKTFNTPNVSGTPQLIPAPLFDTLSISTFNGQVDAFGNKIKSLPNIIQAEMLKASVFANEGLIRLTVLLQEFDAAVRDLIQNSIATTFSDLGTAIGNSIATGGNVLSAIGNTLISALAGFLSQLGDKLIQYGLLLAAFGKAEAAFIAGDPVTKIGAGLAMVALGIAVKAASGAVGSAARTSGGGASGGSGAGANNSSFTSGGFSSRGDGGGTVVFEIAGQKLIGVLSNTINANKRLGGTLGLG